MSFFLGLCLVTWLGMAGAFVVHYAHDRNLLDLVSATACVMACVGPLRETHWVHARWDAPLYVVGFMAAGGGLCGALWTLAQWRRR